MMSIRKAAVIGAGVMGAGIAAHLANAGVEVVLLDMTRERAAEGIARQLKTGGFMDAAFASRVHPGSTTEDLSLLADADWIIEAVAERLDIKQALYRAVDAVRKPGSFVSSNTSTIPLASLISDLPEQFARDFLITHFFNPPRHMRLLELVSGPQTNPEAVETIRSFADRHLGKAVVICKDTPGFIGNRVGNYWMAVAQDEAIRLGLDVEEADAVVSKPFGIPSTGIFGLLDLVGIDLMVTILQTLQSSLPASDALQACDAAPPLVQRMIAENRTGRKAGGGFVRLSADRKKRDVIDLQTGEYRPQRPVSSASLEASKGDPRVLMEHDGLGGRYAAIVMEKALAYAASLVPEISDTPDAVDLAMRTGYGWKHGPFELMDHLGAGWLSKRLQARGIAVPAYLSKAAENGGFYTVRDGRRMALLPDGSYQPVADGEGVLTIAALSRATSPVMNGAASKLWDLGDGVACFEFRTKMNTISPALLDDLDAALRKTKESFRALVIGGDAPVFSAGADLRLFLDIVESGPSAIGDLIDHGHRTFRAVKYAPFPVVGAAAGLALGGGCELLLHCDAIQAHAELSIGLVETRIGVIPGWGGCKEMLLRFADASDSADPAAPALAAFARIAPAKVSANAFEARRLGFLRESDGITMNRDRLIADAKHKALELAAGYQPPAPRSILLSGAAGASALRNALESEALTPHARVIGETLIHVLSGGRDAQSARPAGEDAVMALEREAFIDLLSTAATIDRVRHTLETGKPLRN